MAAPEQFSDTIFALSTGSMPSGVAIVRISGPHCRDLLARLAPGPSPSPRRFVRRDILNLQGETLDSGGVLFFPAPNSFTGEDVAELHLHGSRAIVNAVLAALGGLDGVRPADAGEFTHRAFLLGKMDLAQAEALAGLIEAETESQRRLAMSGLGGRQSALYEDWRSRLLDARALFEAGIDFSDEGDVSEEAISAGRALLPPLLAAMDAHLSGAHLSEILRDGFRIVIAGAPNVGKSSLLNALARRDAAIVTDEAGTTRDPVEVTFELSGQKIIVTDTAGLRSTDGKAESIGIDMARERIRSADLVLHVEAPDIYATVSIETATDSTIRILNKSDMLASPVRKARDYDIVISSRSEGDIERLKKLIVARIAATETTDILPLYERHIGHIRESRREVSRAFELLDAALAAEHLRRGADALGRITGRMATEEVLGAIFARFCIGK